MINCVCNTAFKSYEESPAFKFKKAFAQAFCSAGKPSASKDKYKCIALGIKLAKSDETFVTASSNFRTYCSRFGDRCLKKYHSGLENGLLDSLVILKTVIPSESESLLEKLSVSALTWDEKCSILQEHGGAVLAALDRASKSQGVETPKLGGVTRWCQDKFVAMEFIANNIDTITVTPPLLIPHFDPKISDFVISSVPG